MRLPDDFVAPFLRAPSPLTALGEFVYTRTYSAWLPEEQRRETWAETVRRAVEYNCSLAPTPMEEAQKLYENIYHTRQFLSGRTLWVGGREISRKHALANFNWAFAVIDSFEAICDLMLLLMLGTGVGFRVLPEDVARLPEISPYVRLDFKPYIPQPPLARQEQTTVVREDISHETRYIITVGDSKEGWVDALRQYLKVLVDAHQDDDRPYRDYCVVVNFDHVRPAGERLKTMGGRASGPDALMEMFRSIHTTVTQDRETPFRLRPVDVLDMCNAVGQAIVVGGVRRTSEIALGSPNDVSSHVIRRRRSHTA